MLKISRYLEKARQHEQFFRLKFNIGPIRQYLFQMMMDARIKTAPL